jgi:uroporphyrinogen-III decarboxylase
MKELPVDIFELDFLTDLALARKTLGPDRVLCGNISTVDTLVHGTPAEVMQEAGVCHSICGPRHIVSPGCEMSPLTPYSNVRAMVQYSIEQISL